MQLVKIELHRPLPQLLLEEMKYKLLSNGWNYKVVTRVAQHFAREIESENDYIYYISKSGNKWNHPFIKGKPGVCKCVICGERLCMHHRMVNGRRSLSVDVENVNIKERTFRKEFSEKNSAGSNNYKCEIKKMYKVVIEKEKPKCFICEKKKKELIVVNDDNKEEEDKEEDKEEKDEEEKEKEEGKEEQHSVVHIEDDNNKNDNDNNNNDNMMMGSSRNELLQELMMKLMMRNDYQMPVQCPVVPQLIALTYPSSLQKIISLKQCKHTICQACLEQTLKEQIKSDTLLLKCPHEDCDAEMDMLHIIEQFSEYNEFRKDLWKYHCITANPHQYIQCPFDNCKGYMNITANDDNNSNNNSYRDINPLSEEPLINAENDSLIQLKQTQPPKFIHCVSLSETEPYIVHNVHSICYYCRFNHDANTSCEEHFARSINSINEHLVRPCPQCGFRYELDDTECNYFKCSRCNYEFCGQCMQQLTYDHYYFSNTEGRCKKTNYEKRCLDSCCHQIIFWIIFGVICLCFPVTLLLFLKEEILHDMFEVEFNFINRPLYVKYRILKILTDVIFILTFNVRAYIFIFPLIVASPLIVIFYVFDRYIRHNY